MVEASVGASVAAWDCVAVDGRQRQVLADQECVDEARVQRWLLQVRDVAGIRDHDQPSLRKRELVIGR
jgi:hypothetical protein